MQITDGVIEEAVKSQVFFGGEFVVEKGCLRAVEVGSEKIIQVFEFSMIRRQ